MADSKKKLNYNGWVFEWKLVYDENQGKNCFEPSKSLNFNFLATYKEAFSKLSVLLIKNGILCNIFLILAVDF